MKQFGKTTFRAVPPAGSTSAKREFEHLYKGRTYTDYAALNDQNEATLDEVALIMANHGSLTGSAAALCADLGEPAEEGRKK